MSDAPDHPFTPDQGAAAALRGAAAANVHALTPPVNSHNGTGHTGTTGKVYPWNDTGNGERLLDAGGRDRLRYVVGRQFPFHLWDGNCWTQDREQRVAKWMDEVLRGAYTATWKNGQPRAAQTEEAKWLLHSGDAAKIAAALTSAGRHVSVLPKVFDTHMWLLPCNDGHTYDMETGQVIASRQDHLMTRCAPVPALRSPEPHPKFDEVVARVMCGESEMITYLLRLMGLFTTGYVGEKSFWFWQGATDAGKTTLLTFLARLLDPFVYNIPLRAVLKHRQDTGILHDIAGTQGMRLVYAEEFKPGDVLDTEWVKRISGGGDITADLKGQPDETFRSTAKLVIGTNDLPTLTDVDTALRGRVRVVPFRANVPAELRKAGKRLQSVDEVVADLMTEAPAILARLAREVEEWREAGKQLGMPKSVADESKRYLDTQDVLIEWMDVCCEKNADGSVTSVREELPLITWYWSFLKQSGRANTNALYQQFGAMLTSKGFEKRAAYDGKRYTGPRLTDQSRSEAEYAVREEELESYRRKHGY